MRIITLIILLLQLLLPEIAGQEWIVPEDKKGRLSTFALMTTPEKPGKFYIQETACHATVLPEGKLP